MFFPTFSVALLVQLDRMSAYGVDGREFDSPTGYLLCRLGLSSKPHFPYSWIRIERDILHMHMNSRCLNTFCGSQG